MVKDIETGRTTPEQRRAQALRENLKRRKAQKWDRGGDRPVDGTDGKKPPDPARK